VSSRSSSELAAEPAAVPRRAEKLGRGATLRGAAARNVVQRLLKTPPKTSLGTKRLTLLQRFLANGSNVCRGGPIPRRSSQGPTVGLWKYMLLDTSSLVSEMYSQCQTDQSF